MSQLQLPNRTSRRRAQRRSPEPARLELTLELPQEMPRPVKDESAETEQPERGVALVDFYI